jgi:hypothetical protein
MIIIQYILLTLIMRAMALKLLYSIRIKSAVRYPIKTFWAASNCSQTSKWIVAMSILQVYFISFMHAHSIFFCWYWKLLLFNYYPYFLTLSIRVFIHMIKNRLICFLIFEVLSFSNCNHIWHFERKKTDNVFLDLPNLGWLEALALIFLHIIKWIVATSILQVCFISFTHAHSIFFVSKGNFYCSFIISIFSPCQQGCALLLLTHICVCLFISSIKRSILPVLPKLEEKNPRKWAWTNNFTGKN